MKPCCKKAVRKALLSLLLDKDPRGNPSDPLSLLNEGYNQAISDMNKKIDKRLDKTNTA